MDKLKLGKHNHKLTDILKVCIFSIVMLAPVFSVVSKCLYVACNKNAYQSYSYKVGSNTTVLENGQTLQIGQLYTVNYIGGLYTGQQMNVLEGKTNIVDLYFTNENWTVDYFTPSYEGVRTRLIVYDTNGQQHNKFLWEETNPQFYFYNRTETTIANTQKTYNVSITTYIQADMDNAFQYAVEQIPNEQIFAWTKNTGIYTPINAMCSGLGFDAQNNVLAVLLTYWMLCTCVYIVIDIVIVCFTKITHSLSGSD